MANQTKPLILMMTLWKPPYPGSNDSNHNQFQNKGALAAPFVILSQH